MRIAPFVGLAVAVAASAVLRGAHAQEGIPVPRLDRVDYTAPEKQLALPKSLGRKETLERIAAEIRGATPREKLAAIGTWMDAHLKYDGSTFDRWRDVDALLAAGNYGGCADHAEFYGAVSRACGIPTVWVKSLDLDWIAWFREHPDQPRSWNGHVFLEVHLDGAWRLYDATQRALYERYDVRQRILPGHRLAYDKGGDPYELVLSTRWEDWKRQTRRFVETLDPSLVPVGAATSLAQDSSGSVFVAANNPEWQWIVDRCRVLGLRVGESGNAAFDRWLPKARRGILVVTMVGGETVLPESHRSLLPSDAAAVSELLKSQASAVVRRKATDGTDVVLLAARDRGTLRTAIDGLTFDAPK